MKTVKRKVVSRRNRPAKEPLSQDVIVSTALKLLKRDGLIGLSMRKVAAALDTGAASLYVYVANLDELHALILDRALEHFHVDQSPDKDWCARLSITLKAYQQILFKYPGLGLLTLTTDARGPNGLRLTEGILALLHEGGVSPRRAAWGIDLFFLHCAAAAAEHHIRNASGNTSRAAIRQIIYDAPAEQYPLVHTLRKELVAGDDMMRAQWAIDTLINGLLISPTSPSVKGKSTATKSKGSGKK